MFQRLVDWVDRVRLSKNLGQWGERIAMRTLQRSGFRILACNLRLKKGEIDILAEEVASGAIVVVEVKSGRSEAFPPELHMGYQKQRKLISLGEELVRMGEYAKRVIRFDVVIVVIPEGATVPSRVTHIKNAFHAR